MKTLFKILFIVGLLTSTAVTWAGPYNEPGKSGLAVGSVAATGNVSGATYGSDGSITDAELLTFDDGLTNEILVGGGAGVAPVWTTATGTGAPVRAGSPTITGVLVINGGQSTKKTNVADADYGTSALTTDYKIAFTSLTAARTATISTEDVQSGTVTQTRDFVFKDESGNAGTYPITISLESGGTINGAASYILNTNYESINIYLNGTNAFTF